MDLYNLRANYNYNLVFNLAIRKTHKTAEGAKGWSSTKMIGAALAIIVVIVIIGIVAFMPHQPAKVTTIPTTTISQYIISGGITSQQVFARLNSYPQQKNFTAIYVGTIDMALPSPYGAINGSVYSSFERSGASALSKTSVVLPSVNQSFNTSQYYASNGIVYTCTSNATNVFTCTGTYSSLINASNFALYFLASSNSSMGGMIGLSNSSYNGASCLMANGGFNTSTNSSGVIVTNLARFSGCIQPEYRVPLFLNLTTITMISGSYYNGTSTTKVTPESEQVFIRLHLSNLTNSSTASEVENLPANAIVLSG